MRPRRIQVLGFRLKWARGAVGSGRRAESEGKPTFGDDKESGKREDNPARGQPFPASGAGPRQGSIGVGAWSKTRSCTLPGHFRATWQLFNSALPCSKCLRRLIGNVPGLFRLTITRCAGPAAGRAARRGWRETTPQPAPPRLRLPARSQTPADPTISPRKESWPETG